MTLFHCHILLQSLMWGAFQHPHWIPETVDSTELYIYYVFFSAAAAAAKSLQFCLTLCDPIDGSPPGSPVPGILQARILERVAISFSNAWKWKVKVKSCPTLSDPMDCSPPGSSVHGIFPGKSTGVGCHCLLRFFLYICIYCMIKFSL